jgi:hypothetical protein
MSLSLTPRLSVLTAAIACAGMLAAQSDNCGQAVTLTMSNTCNPVSGTVDGATESIAPITCGPYTGTSDDDVWYKFVATATDATIELTCNSSFDGVIDLRFGACNGSNIACADQVGTNGNETLSATNLSLGNTYYIRLYDYGTGYPADPNFTICVWSVNASATAVNDNCAQAITLTMGNSCTPVSGTVDQATQSIAPISCGGATGDSNDDVWYKFVATGPNAVIELVGSATFDGVLDLRSGACNGSNIACSDAPFIGAPETIAATGLTIGTTYYIRVYDYATGYPTDPTFTICVYGGQGAPVNDACPGATLLTVGDAVCTPTTGDVANASNAGTGNCDFDTGYDLWYRFVAPAPTVVVRVDPSAGFDAKFAVVGGSCANQTYIACVDEFSGNGGLEERVLNGLTVGGTYRVQVYPSNGNLPTTTTFTICVFSLPLFDECAGATPLTMQATCSPVNGDAGGATDSNVGANCNGQGESDDDVWYSFVATGGDVRITVDGNGSYDPIIHLRYGCPGNSIACSNTSGAGGTEILEFQGISIGNTYSVQVYDAGAGQPSNTTYTICVQDISAGIGVEEISATDSPWLLRNTNDPRLFTLGGTRNLRTTWSVFDALGRQVINGSATIGTAVQTPLDLHALPTGAYTLLLSGEGQQASKRFMLP